jgi:predicted small metal-binding protein
MAKVLQCRDLGFDCDGVVRGETNEEVLQGAAQHAQEVHGISPLPDEDKQQAMTLIRDEGASSPSR